MQDNWQAKSRKVLKTAHECNEYFNTDVFQDNNFGIKIPLEFAEKIEKNNKLDPLLKQVCPQKSVDILNFSQEPLNDKNHSPVAGLIHKYKNRALLIASRVCSIHCQYCFRQNFPYSDNDGYSNLDNIVAYLNKHTEINEVILSGGDPLSLNDEKLEKLVSVIGNIEHMDTLRIHSRSIVVVPSRITNEFIDIINNCQKNLIVVTHINHASEIGEDFKKNIAKLNSATLLNQSVLLKGVNDDIATLKDLSLRLHSVKILPYYLHMLDKVKGAENYLVDDAKAHDLHNKLKQELSGYLVPRLVRDNEGKSKDWLL